MNDPIEEIVAEEVKYLLKRLKRLHEQFPEVCKAVVAEMESNEKS